MDVKTVVHLRVGCMDYAANAAAPGFGLEVPLGLAPVAVALDYFEEMDLPFYFLTGLYYM